MKFMLLCYDDEQAWNRAGEEELHSAMRQAVALTHELAGRGQYMLASPLHSVSTAKTVRLQGGEKLVVDGPFAETKEQLGGFYLIDAKDQEEALAIAAKHPGLRFGSVEVRPVVELPGLPQPSLK